jgi:hypothetical protein
LGSERIVEIEAKQAIPIESAPEERTPDGEGVLYMMRARRVLADR